MPSVQLQGEVDIKSKVTKNGRHEIQRNPSNGLIDHKRNNRVDFYRHGHTYECNLYSIRISVYIHRPIKRLGFKSLKEEKFVSLEDVLGLTLHETDTRSSVWTLGLTCRTISVIGTVIVPDRSRKDTRRLHYETTVSI